MQKFIMISAYRITVKKWFPSQLSNYFWLNLWLISLKEKKSLINYFTHWKKYQIHFGQFLHRLRVKGCYFKSNFGETCYPFIRVKEINSTARRVAPIRSIQPFHIRYNSVNWEVWLKILKKINERDLWRINF